MQIKGGNWVSAKELPNCTLQDDTINLHCCEILSETRMRMNNKIVFIQFPSSFLSCFLLCPDPIVETEDAMKHLFLDLITYSHFSKQNIYLSSSFCANFTWTTTTTCCVFLEHSTKKIQLFFAFILSVSLCRQFWNENLRENDDDSTRTRQDERTRWSLWSVQVCFVWNCRDFISIKPSSTWLTQIKIHREQDSKIQRKFMRFFKGFGLHSSRVWCLLECVNRICGKHFFGWFLFDRCPLCVVLSFWCISKEMRNLVTWQFTTFYSKKKILSDCRIDASQNGISLFFPSSTGLGPIQQRWHVMLTKAWKI